MALDGQDDQEGSSFTGDKEPDSNNGDLDERRWEISQAEAKAQQLKNSSCLDKTPNR